VGKTGVRSCHDTGVRCATLSAVGLLEWVSAKVEKLWQAQESERVLPDDEIGQLSNNI
jgi:hypothetical protein